MPLRRQAGHGRVRMLRILKGSSPQQETKTQPQKEQLPKQMVPFSPESLWFWVSQRFQTQFLLSPTPSPSSGPLLPPKKLPSQCYLERGLSLIETCEATLCGNQANQLVSNTNLRWE